MRYRCGMCDSFNTECGNFFVLFLLNLPVNNMSARSALLQRSVQEPQDLIVIAMAYKLFLKKHQKRRHRWWIHSILQKRAERGAFNNLVNELQLDGERFQQYFRVTKFSLSREVICPKQRLAICLR